MSSRRTILAAALCAGVACAPPARAQATRADSAAVLLEAARVFDARGQHDLADALHRYLRDRFAGTPAADSAEARLRDRPRGSGREGSGRTALVAWSTVFGAWLGVATPAMLSADGPTPYGVGLLLGGPAGFLLSNAYARGSGVTTGQADAMAFGFLFGSGQGLGWQQALNLGDRTVDSCGPPTPCPYREERGTAPFAAMVIGGATGMVTAAVVGRQVRPTLGQSSFAGHAAFWGTWLGLAFSVDAADGDNVVKTMLVGGDLGLVAGALAAPRDVSAGRVWLTSASGVAGTAVGFGLALLFDVNSAEAAFRLVGGGTIAGLAAGWLLTGDLDRRAALDVGAAPWDAALVDLRGGSVLNVPRVQPTLLRVATGPRGDVRRPGLVVPLLRAQF